MCLYILIRLLLLVHNNYCLLYQKRDVHPPLAPSSSAASISLWEEESEDEGEGDDDGDDIAPPWSPISCVDEEEYQMIDQHESECDAEVDETDVDYNLDNLLVSIIMGQL